MAGLTAAGWQVLHAVPGLSAWLDAARPAIARSLADPDMRRRWLRHGDTWFAGVDALANDAVGRPQSATDRPVARAAAANAPPLPATLRAALAELPLHSGQISAVYPGYPGRDPGESAAAHRYRVGRAAAHVDGLLPVGPDRRRYLREPHAAILGLPVTRAAAGAAPLTVWEGSHRIIGPALAAVLRPHPVASWPDIDVTEAYHAARRKAFETCPRREIVAAPGDAIVLHRHLLHGIAPWRAGTGAAKRRVVVYFRPCWPCLSDWIDLP